MAYRDPETGARARLDEARERVDAHEERMTPALIDRLPRALNERLQQAGRLADEAVKTATSVASIHAASELLDAYTAVLEEALRRAPKLARAFNRLPRAFPQRAATGFVHQFPDVFSAAQLSLRTSLHADVDALDPEARLFDKRTGYFDTARTPYLVEACFRIDYTPLRLQVVAVHEDLYRTTGTHQRVRSDYCLLTGVRPSAPELRVTVGNRGRTMLSMIGLLRDTSVGDAELDRAFVIDADPEDARRVLEHDAKRALHRLAQRAELSVLHIEDGLARLEWRESMVIRMIRGQPTHEFTSSGLDDAIDLMLAIRAIPPTPLLRRLQRSKA